MYRSPETGRFISHAAFARWYAPGAPKHDDYREMQERTAQKDAPGAGEIPPELFDDWLDLEEFDAPIEYEGSGEYGEE